MKISVEFGSPKERDLLLNFIKSLDFKKIDRSLFFGQTPKPTKNHEKDLLLTFEGDDLSQACRAICAWAAFKSTAKKNNQSFILIEGTHVFVTDSKNADHNSIVVDNKGIFTPKTPAFAIPAFIARKRSDSLFIVNFMKEVNAKFKKEFPNGIEGATKNFHQIKPGYK